MVEAKVAILDTVGVQHGHYLKNEQLSQQGSRPLSAQQKVYDSLCEVRRGSLGGVNSGCNHDNWSVSEPKLSKTVLEGPFFRTVENLLTKHGLMLLKAFHIPLGSDGQQGHSSSLTRVGDGLLVVINILAPIELQPATTHSVRAKNNKIRSN